MPGSRESSFPLFRCGRKELDYLRKKDKKLGLAIDRIGPLEREIIPDLFTALIRNIVAQQISKEAMVTIWGRMKERFGDITPARFGPLSPGEIQACGVHAKGGVHLRREPRGSGGDLDLGALQDLSDEEVIERLSSLRGVGRWTAEMLLIFSMKRPDVLSYGDLAIRRGIMTLYGHKTLDRERFDRYKKRYSPYGSTASLYLWEISAEG
ncbi:DNA-3-methyladenine glycosylase [Aminivibrio sp.]